MNTIKDRDQVVYYYKNLTDLMTKEKEFLELQIRTNIFGNEPVRICPRCNSEQEEIWHILLLDTGNKTKDLETLKVALGKFKREFRGEL